MKRIALLVCLILSLVLTVACVNEDYDLGLKLEEGKEYRLSTSMSQNIKQELMGNQISIEQVMDMVYSFKVEEVDEEGNYLLTAKYTKLDVNLENLRSDLPKEAQEKMNQEINNNITKGMNPLLNKEFTMKMSKSGDIIEIEGYEKLIESMILNMSEDGNPHMAETMKSLFNKESVKKMWKQNLSYLPDHPVDIGDSWTTSFKLDQPLPMSIVTTYTLKSVDKDKVILETDGIIKMGDIDFSQFMNIPQQEELEIDFNFDGNQTGDIVLNTSNLWIREMKLNQTMSGSITVSNKNVDQAIEIPMEIISKAIITGSY